ncbi:ThiF family adenylyltransferase [Actinoplanes sp. NBRC 103695]|uniref:ThiF family adenylyltransferase n=1 Tax=Actinoplanes sp. NBRC 103695 TaxID=3032202 RepID=UPI0024A132E4|nr:ThiF family adenylyltransferase [Actinoplanes sp. NBRC 103695]GLY99654.1 thiamine biosynthesis protein ThiF [Actinoplanes sp. NBRC 103695]
MATHTPLSPWSLVIPGEMMRDLERHLFPGDGDEHGAIVVAGITSTPRGTRLLARELFLARDGQDYLPGTRGYRMLSASFIRDRIRHCRDEQLVYLAVHCHGGNDSVAFSATDMASHRRGYPALLDIAKGQPVGALVFARNAVAGDIWLADGTQVPLSHTRVLGTPIRTLRPAPRPLPAHADATYDRHTRLFGDRGQDVLAGLKVGVIGAGGAGSLIIQQLSRLGVGHLIIADPERIEITNLPRVAGSTQFDALAWLVRDGRPEWLRRLGKRFAAPKVRIAARTARTANPAGKVDAIFGDITHAAVADRFVDCDYLFLAADSMQARLVFNALTHQYLIPGAQVGAKVQADKATGEILDVFAVYRPVTPDLGCLWCNGLINSSRLQDEAVSVEERQAQRYVDDPTVIAPSVITLNAIASAHATNDFLFTVTGLLNDAASTEYLRFLPASRDVRFDQPRKDVGCLECGFGTQSRRARGDLRTLPTRQRQPG